MFHQFVSDSMQINIMFKLGVLLSGWLVLVHTLGTERELIPKLLDHYDKRVGPLPVDLKLGLNIIRVLDLDKDKNILTLDTWLTMTWSDDRLDWDPKEYNYTDSVKLLSTDVWIPDITLYNNADDLKPLPSTMVNVFTGGDMLYVPPIKLRSYCNVMGIQNGTVTCMLNFGSWVYDGTKVKMGLFGKGVELSDFHGWFNRRVRLLTTNSAIKQNIYECCPDTPYETVVFSVTLQVSSLTDVIVP